MYHIVKGVRLPVITWVTAVVKPLENRRSWNFVIFYSHKVIDCTMYMHKEPSVYLLAISYSFKPTYKGNKMPHSYIHHIKCSHQTIQLEKHAKLHFQVFIWQKRIDRLMWYGWCWLSPRYQVFFNLSYWIFIR